MKKKIDQLKEGDLVFLQGIDLTSQDQIGWASAERVSQETPAIFEAIGFVCSVNKDTISLAGLSVEDSKEGAHYGCFTIIPRGCIKKVTSIPRRKK